MHNQDLVQKNIDSSFGPLALENLYVLNLTWSQDDVCSLWICFLWEPRLEWRPRQARSRWNRSPEGSENQADPSFFYWFLTAMLVRAVLQSTLSICIHCCSFGYLVPKWATIESYIMFRFGIILDEIESDDLRITWGLFEDDLRLIKEYRSQL